MLFSDEQLAAPELIRIEVAGALSRKAREKAIREADALDALNLWDDIITSRVEISPDSVDIFAGFQLALSLHHPIQDCLYLAVANRRAVDLLTADKSFVQKARSAHANLRLLS